MRHLITGVERGGVAYALGLQKGDALLAIDGADVVDEIDYQALASPARLTLTVQTRQGARVDVPVAKEEGQPLGLRFGPSMALSPRPCRNHCRFCFIDQMPPGMRASLYVKDDDWRYSLMMGNFVTLTNVDDAEFERIVARRASPLYVSVHAADPDARVALMRNPAAANLWPRLERLRAEGLAFHAQIVCCPGYNDGDVLLQTVRALRALTPACRSVAVVPVGLTRYREKLDALTPFDGPAAAALLDALTPLQAEAARTLGHAFVFPSDEFFSLSGRPVPPESWYAGYPQIENGVGLLRLLAEQMAQAAREAGDAAPAGDPLNDAQSAAETLSQASPRPADRAPTTRPLLLLTGKSAAPYLARLCAAYAPPGARVDVQAVRNHFFGESVTVAGLLTGGDVLAQLPPDAKRRYRALLLSRGMLRHEGDRFLDDMTLRAFRRRYPLRVRLVGPSGAELHAALRG